MELHLNFYSSSAKCNNTLIWQAPVRDKVRHLTKDKTRKKKDKTWISI